MEAMWGVVSQSTSPLLYMGCVLAKYKLPLCVLVTYEPLLYMGCVFAKYKPLPNRTAAASPDDHTAGDGLINPSKRTLTAWDSPTIRSRQHAIHKNELLHHYISLKKTLLR